MELLPEARAETTARWLAGHPGIEIVSRDRAGVFADAAALGSPQAVQVADRWHLLRNLWDVAERVLVGLSLPPIRVEKTESAAKLPAATEPKERETRQDAERRQALCDEIHELYEKTSNGRAEGYINKLKLLKRQMYGRAGIELLRRRFLAMGR